MSTCSVSLTISGSPESVAQVVEKVKGATRQTGPNQCEVELAAIVESPDGNRFFGCHEAIAIREVQSGVVELVGVADEFPPLDFAVALSKQWPELAFDLRSGSWDEDIHIAVSNGDCVQKYLRQDSFVATPVGEGLDLTLPPLHHWNFYLDIPNECRLPEQAVLDTLEKSGYLRRWGGDKCVSRHDPVDLCKQLSGVLTCQITPRGIMRFSLDEKHYLDRLLQGLPPGPIPDHTRQCIRVMERGILLMDEEIESVVHGLIGTASGPFAVDRLERLRNQLGTAFTSKYGQVLDQYAAEYPEDHICKWWTQPYLGLPESVRRGYGEYAPTKQELEMVIEAYSTLSPIAKERTAILTQAINSPRWCTFWPEWEARVTAQQSIERLFAKPYDGPDFLEELRNGVE